MCERHFWDGPFLDLKERINDVVHEQSVSTTCEQGMIPIDDNLAKDFIVSCCTDANNSVADECHTFLTLRFTSMRKGSDQPRHHARKLAFHLNISFYLIQHAPHWRSKFDWIRTRIRIKKTRTKIGTLGISHTSSKLHRDRRAGSFTKTNLRIIAGITYKVW